MSWREAADVILERAGEAPRIGIVLGSGLGQVAEAVDGATAIPYSDLPGFPEPTVEGHAGQAVAGRIGGVPVLALQGRAHLYEGGDLDLIRVPVRALRAAGAEILLLTNAAGSLQDRPRARQPDADRGPHQPDRHERPGRPQRRRARPALPEPARRLRPGAARADARGRAAISTSSSSKASTSR